MLVRLKYGKYLRKVEWDQMWHLLDRKPGKDPFSETPMVPWKRITSQAAGGYLRHRNN